MGEFLIDLWGLMKERKKFWLLPIIVCLVMLGGWWYLHLAQRWRRSSILCFRLMTVSSSWHWRRPRVLALKKIMLIEKSSKSLLRIQ